MNTTNSDHNSAFSIGDIEHLSRLSRLSLTEEEKVKFANEIGSILAYVGQIQSATDGVSNTASPESRTEKSYYSADLSQKNRLRDDVVSSMETKLNPDSVPLIESAPEHTSEYIKVKKILGGSQ